MATQEEIDRDPLNGGDDDEDILQIAKRRFRLAEQAEVDQRIEQIDDLEFLIGKQWPDEIKRERDADGRPCLTINRLPQYANQITNDQRQNRPSIKVNPADDQADIDTAKVLQGLIRKIQSKSRADEAYDTAFEGSVHKGLGYYRVITQYASPTSFDQEIQIKRIRNSFTVYPDPNYQECDGSDMNWCFVFENMPIEDFKDQFPDSKISSADQLVALGDMPVGWINESTVRVAEYFYKSYEHTTIVQLSDGRICREKDAKEAMKPVPGAAAMTAPPVTIVTKRKTTLPAIKWVKFSAAEILEKQDWAGQWIPIIPVHGKEYDIDGRRILQGIVRPAKDPQRMYNYWNSNATETIALAPKAPYVGAAGQFEGFENTWDEANTKNFAYLEYNPVELNGQTVPPPQRNSIEPAIGATTTMLMHSGDDIKQTTGVFDPSLGSAKGDPSGVAVQKLNTQAQTGNFHFVDNLSRSLRHGGRICLDLIPFVYNKPAVIQILGEDGKTESVVINKMFMDQKSGQQKSHILSRGQYECEVGTGPSYATKRQETSATMLELSRSWPKVLDVAADIMVGNMDWAGADLVAERLKKTMAPGIVETPADGQQPLPPQVTAQMQQMQGMIQQLTQHLQEKTKLVEQKTMELESKERIETMKVKAQVEIALATLKAKGAEAVLDHEIDILSSRETQLGMNEPIDSETDPVVQNSPPANVQPPTGGPSPGNQSMGG